MWSGDQRTTDALDLSELRRNSELIRNSAVLRCANADRAGVTQSENFLRAFARAATRHSANAEPRPSSKKLPAKIARILVADEDAVLARLSSRAALFCIARRGQRSISTTRAGKKFAGTQPAINGAACRSPARPRPTSPARRRSRARMRPCRHGMLERDAPAPSRARGIPPAPSRRTGAPSAAAH